jgi:hypothetical protein
MMYLAPSTHIISRQEVITIYNSEMKTTLIVVGILAVLFVLFLVFKSDKKPVTTPSPTPTVSVSATPSMTPEDRGK